MPTYDAGEAEQQVAPQQMEAFKKALADAEAEGKEVYSVFISNGVPILFSIRDKA
ncbi:hypothetical protein ACL00Q_04250 [Curtobacterium flaccumfaciens pv. flaccumfaciens]|uniref:hypothetical protein n=1 Tax=Curtobacterium flaccumfaciens TaxID=2035 RepID=UPI0039A08304